MVSPVNRSLFLVVWLSIMINCVIPIFAEEIRSASRGVASASSAGTNLKEAAESVNLIVGKEEQEIMYQSRWPLLLVDKYLVAKADGVSLTVCEAARYSSDPIIKRGDPGSPDEKSIGCGSVYYIDGKFRMWGGGAGAAGAGVFYAESQDGIHWIKPNLGLQEYNGNYSNNLVKLSPKALDSYQ